MKSLDPRLRTPDMDACCIGPDGTIAEAVARIDANAKGIVLVVDDDRRLIGTVTDGDVRRALLGNMSLDLPLNRLLAHKSATAPVRPLTAPVGTTDAELLHVMNENALRHLPLLDTDGRVADLAVLSEMARGLETSLRAVVMAGGFGTRLRPLTEDTPKPMLPVGDRPLLAHTVDQLKASGIHRVAMTTHYRPEKITEYFGDGADFGVEIDYLQEPEPLGTAGALSMLEDSSDTLVVINGDILTNVDFGAMAEFHRASKAALTMAVRPYSMTVPYGVVECDGIQVRKVVEKPTHTFFVNAGIYLVEPSARRLIPGSQKFDMPDLVEKLIAAGLTVASFPIREYWLDIGRPEDYQRANLDVEQGRLNR